MSLDTKNVKEKLLMHYLGDRYRTAHAKEQPIGDKMINAVRDAISDAWQMGLEGGRIYPSIPLLEQLTQRSPEPHEPEL